jgi:hypothetical protein
MTLQSIEFLGAGSILIQRRGIVFALPKLLDSLSFAGEFGVEIVQMICEGLCSTPPAFSRCNNAEQEAVEACSDQNNVVFARRVATTQGVHHRASIL